MNSALRLFSADSSDEHIVNVLNQVKETTPADEAIAAELARILADSGEKFAAAGGITADVASTGGPSSLTTLLCPLYLRAAGLLVPKLGVPGRPAGGIDCLAQIEGFKVDLTTDELRAAMADAGYAHFLAAGRYAPLDARVFKLRQQYGSQDVPTLVAASLLSKKLAVGVRRAGLDVRVAPHGNFGKTREDARNNAKLFATAARRLGVEAYPVLTDGVFPYQPFIGRREALAAMAQLFGETASAWLRGHASHCLQLALAVVPADARKAAAEAALADLKRHFVANLVAQGATADAFDRLAIRTLADHKHVLHAAADGFTSYSLDGIRRTFVRYQSSGKVSQAGFPDPVGLVLLREPGEWVEKGQPVATVRVEPDTVVEQVMMDLQDCVCRTTGVPKGPKIEGVALDE